MLWHRGRAYGQDLRDRVLSAPGSIAQIAARFAVSAAYVSKVRRSRRLGQLSAGAQCNHVPAKLAGLEPAVAAHLAAQDDQTLRQLRAWLLAEHGVTVSDATLCKTLGRLGLTLKKSRCTRPNSTVPM